MYQLTGGPKEEADEHCILPLASLRVLSLQADDMFELARVAEEYGSGEIRLTVEQNVIIPSVTTAKAALLLRDRVLLRLSLSPGNLMGSVVACTGSQFCGQAIIETKERARKVRISTVADEEWLLSYSLRNVGQLYTCKIC